MRRGPMARGDSQMTRTPMKRGTKPMRKRGGKPEVGSVRDLERQLDELVRRVLRRDEPICFTCGKPGTAGDPLEVSHLFGRSFRPTRYDVHVDGNNHSQHHSENMNHNRDKSIYRNEYIKRFGEEAYSELKQRALSNKIHTWIELHAMILQRESMLLK